MIGRGRWAVGAGARGWAGQLKGGYPPITHVFHHNLDA
jgi:hypothetical protein